jgi:hypothetical protein
MNRNRTSVFDFLARVQNSPSSTELLARACDELSGQIVARFGGNSVIKPSGELVKDPEAFSNQISTLCSIQDVGLHELQEQLKFLKVLNSELGGTKRNPEPREMSPSVAAAVQKILSSLSEVSSQMRKEYESLLKRLQ